MNSCPVPAKGVESPVNRDQQMLLGQCAFHTAHYCYRHFAAQKKKTASQPPHIFICTMERQRFTVVAWTVTLQDTCPRSNPQEPECVAFIIKRVFADITKLRLLRWDHPRLSEWTRNPVPSVLERDKQRRDTLPCDRWGRNWGDLARSQVIPPEGERSKERIFPRVSRECVTLPTPQFQPSGQWNNEKINVCCSKPRSL